MPKDFARKDGGGRQTAKKGLPGWVWLIVGIAIGFVGAAGWYVTRPRIEAAAANATANAKAAPADKKKITIPPKEPSRFAFYELLPKYEVLIPKERLQTSPKGQPSNNANGTTTSPATTEHEGVPPAGRYVIQVGAFKDRKEADQQRANLALLGVESRIETVTIDNSTTWYRVRIGPEKDQRKVESILTRLEENNVQATVMMVTD